MHTFIKNADSQLFFVVIIQITHCANELFILDTVLTLPTLSIRKTLCGLAI